LGGLNQWRNLTNVFVQKSGEEIRQNETVGDKQSENEPHDREKEKKQREKCALTDSKSQSF